ncbi:hypothetical protein DJ030_02990 [bacterium endosymbiont of Escarpia laminata]|nr:MAG: hypothetical protein DJ030_02990 [bacterium endosymbiont of Escarpia laminata]
MQKFTISLFSILLFSSLFGNGPPEVFAQNNYYQQQQAAQQARAAQQAAQQAAQRRQQQAAQQRRQQELQRQRQRQKQLVQQQERQRQKQQQLQRQNQQRQQAAQQQRSQTQVSVQRQQQQRMRQQSMQRQQQQKLLQQQRLSKQQQEVAHNKINRLNKLKERQRRDRQAKQKLDQQSKRSQIFALQSARKISNKSIKSDKGNMKAGGEPPSNSRIYLEKHQKSKKISNDNSPNRNIYHATSSAKNIDYVLKKIDISKSLPEKNRFGSGFYLAGSAKTSFKEVGPSSKYTIRYNLDVSKAKILDLTNKNIAKKWNYKSDYDSSQRIAKQAKKQGYEVIQYRSEKASTDTNYVILKNSDKFIKAEGVAPSL